MFEDELRVLLVEDNPDDLRFLRRALENSAARVNVAAASDGTDALELLRSGATPDLVVLDLNLPGVSGFDVLQSIKQDPQLRRLPVLVLTTSKNPADIRRAYDAHANAFITKPPGFDEYDRVAEAIRDFWFGLATLPRVASRAI